MLMKLSPGVNFTNILRSAFSCESVLQSFSLNISWLCNVLLQEYHEEVAHKMLLKLTTAQMLSLPGDPGVQLGSILPELWYVATGITVPRLDVD
jgi:hypothetical protein